MIGLQVSFASVTPTGGSFSRHEVAPAGEPARLDPDSYLGPNFQRGNNPSASSEDATNSKGTGAESEDVTQVRGECPLVDLGGTRLAILHEVARAV